MVDTVAAVVSVVTFFFTEDTTLAIILADRWTLLMTAFLIVQVISALLDKEWRELGDNKNNTETARS